MVKPAPFGRCWVCGKPLGPVVGHPTKTSCAVVVDPIGNEHRTHLVCAKDADGKFVGTKQLQLDER